MIDKRIDIEQKINTLMVALLLIMIGSLFLIPKEPVSGGVWFIGVGAILLFSNLLRLIFKTGINVLTTLLGALAIIAGVTDFNVTTVVQYYPLALIVVGIILIINLVKKK